MIDLHRWEDEGGRIMNDGHDGGEHEDERVKACLERHGFYMRPGPGEALWVFIPVGVDADGAPLERARRSFADEARWWREGRFNDIARGLKADGHPVRVAQAPRGLWRRMATALRKIAWRWTT